MNIFKTILKKFKKNKPIEENNNDKKIQKWENYESFANWFRDAIKLVSSIRILNSIPLDLGKFISYPFDLNRFEAAKNYQTLSKFLIKEIEENNNKLEQNNKVPFIEYNDDSEFSKILISKIENKKEFFSPRNFDDTKELIFRVWSSKKVNEDLCYSVYETGIVVFNYIYTIDQLLEDKNEDNVFLKLLFDKTFSDVFNSNRMIEDFNNLSNTAKVKFIQNFVNFHFLEKNNFVLNKNIENDKYENLFFLKKRKEILEIVQKLKLVLHKKDFWTKTNGTENNLKSRKKLNRPLSMLSNYSKPNYDGFSFIRSILFQPENFEIIEISKWCQSITYKGIHNYLKWNNIISLEQKLEHNNIFYLDDNSSKYKCSNNEGLIKTNNCNLVSILRTDKKNDSVKTFINSFNLIQSFWMLSDSLTNNISKVDYDFYGLKNSLPILNYYNSKLKDFNSGVQNSPVLANLKKDIYNNCDLEEKFAGALAAIQARFAIEDGNKEKKKAINAGVLQLTVLVFAGIASFATLNRFFGKNGTIKEMWHFYIWGPIFIIIVLLIAAFASYLDKKK
ncbi:MAG: hypothetical protein ACTTJO_03075 [Metamycoplasmataceae bacterium]